MEQCVPLLQRLNHLLPETDRLETFQLHPTPRSGEDGGGGGEGRGEVRGGGGEVGGGEGRGEGYVDGGRVEPEESQWQGQENISSDVNVTT